MATRAEILNGADFKGWEDYCAAVANAIKNHYRVSDPCVNMISRQPGEILSDPDDDKLYHVTGASGYSCNEILQRLDVVEADLNGPPSDTDLDTLFTSPAEVGNGCHRYVRDIHSGGVLYHIVSDGVNWWYQAMTMAV